MSIKKSADIKGIEIDAALAQSGTPQGKLFKFATTGNMEHPLRVVASAVLLEYDAACRINQSSQKEIERLKNREGALMAELAQLKAR